MSSMIRRLQIRMMQRANYTREKFIGIVDPITGSRQIREVSRGGEITDPDDNPIGRRWPLRTPERAKPASNLKAKDLLARRNRHARGSGFTPRAARRSKRSQHWLEQRAAARREQA